MLIVSLIYFITPNDGVIFANDGKTLVRANKDLEKYTVPSIVEIFEDGTDKTNCFGECTILKTLSFLKDSKLRYIGKYSFLNSRLTHIDFSNCSYLEIIESNAFDNGLFETIILPDSVSIFSFRSFSSSKLNNFKIPLSLKVIPYMCFIGATSLRNVIFQPNSQLYSIEVESFSTAGITSINIPASITSLGAAFNGCPLQTVTVDPENQNYTAVSNVVLTKNLTKVIFCAYAQKSFVFPKEVKEISMGAFRGTLIQDVLLNEGLNYSEAWTFATTKKIYSIEIPTTLKKISWAMFAESTISNITFRGNTTEFSGLSFLNCKNLISLTLPKYLVSIGNQCFEYCSELKYIWIPKTVNGINPGAFAGIHPNCHLDFENGSNFIMDNDVLYSKEYINLISFIGYSKRKVIPINENTNRILDSAFAGFDIYEVDISRCNLISIGQKAFSQTKLGKFKIPEGITALYEETFYECTNLTELTLPQTLTSIGESCFAKCVFLCKINITPRVTNISKYCFKGCTELKEIKFEEESKLEAIGDEAFAEIAVKKIFFPHTLKECGYSILRGSSVELISISKSNNGECKFTSVSTRLFEYCENLIEVNLGNNLQKIKEYGFRGCISLKSFVLPETVISIEQGAFEDCINLTTFEIPQGSLESIDNRCFSGCNSLCDLKVSMTNLKYTADGKCLFDIDKTILYLCVPGYTIDIFRLPDSIKSVGIYAMQGCRFIERIILPKNLERVEMFAFDGCSKLKSIDFPQSVNYIGQNALRNCRSLGCGSIDYKGNNPILFDESGAPGVSLKPCPTVEFTFLNSDLHISVGFLASAIHNVDSDIVW